MNFRCAREVEVQWSSSRDVEVSRRTLKEVPAERGRTERGPRRAGTGEGHPTVMVGGRSSLLGLAVGFMLERGTAQRISTSVIHYVEDREGGGDFLLENSRCFAGSQPQGGEMFRPELDVESIFLWACSLFSTTLFGVPFPLPTPQGRRAQQLKTRPESGFEGCTRHPLRA